MRVITGSARGVRLCAPEGLRTRPTSARVKEGMFSAIQFSIPGAQVLDLFSGSGQLGIEALSRGASKCIFVDSDREAVSVIRKNLSLTKLEDKAVVRQNDVEAFLKSCGERFHLVFVDAPYHGGQLGRVLHLLSSLLTADGAILCESAEKEDLPRELGEFCLYRTYKYSNTKITLYRHKNTLDPQSYGKA